MKTRIKIYILSMGLALTLSSCEKWFDVTADNQIKAEDQFASADGFRDALMGVYQSMGSRSYRDDMTFNLIDILSQQYMGFTSNLASRFAVQSYNYTEVRAEQQIQAIWNNLYFSIANVNSALSHLDKSDFTWHKGEKEIIKGELLALRAFLHFDLMRVFGHSNYANRPELSSRMAIPYVSTYSKELTGQLTYTQTLGLMEADITAALELLKYDPAYANTLITGQDMAEINRDGFYNNRNKRMNYYAVKALQARLYAWQGGAKMEAAARAAEEVIDHSFANLLQSGTNVLNDKKMSEEQLFGLDVADLFLFAQMFFDGSSNTNYEALRIGIATAESLYETSIPEIGAADVRFNTLLVTEPLGKVSIKYRYQSPNAFDATTMPLIKLPEMYYIAAEYYSTSNMAKAVGLLQAVRSSRRIVHQLSTSMSKETFDAELLKEYRKEYVSEGQLFFFYKRQGFTTIPNYSTAVVADDKIYMLPIPASEVEFGDRVQ